MTTGDRITRRGFSLSALGGLALASCREPAGRPNILWITSEDNGPFLGCYGDSYATTPNLDRMASEGVLYENAFAAYPVCAPSRSTLITGVCANSLGSGQMRSVVGLPANVRMFPSFLREAGYYCTNNSKEDYNTTTPEGVWDQSDREASYRSRAEGQPFFHVRNLTVSHESSLFKQRQPVHDPAEAALPPYHPDTPVFRSDWAQYYDHVARMDEQAGQILDELAADGLDRETIVFYFSDHGGILPRSKRFVYDSGCHVPLIVRFPEAYRHLAPSGPGSRTGQLVSFVDFAPSVLRLAGIGIPDYMQGSAFLGTDPRPKPRDYVHIARDRMGSSPNLVRAVRDKRYKYVRNYLPQLPAGQYNTYQLGIPSWVEIFELEEAGKLNRTQRLMFEPRETEELYDTAEDPHEVNNLAGLDVFAETLARFREENNRHLLSIRETAFIPEIEMQRLTAGSTPYDFARDPEKYPLERIMEVADMAAERDTANLPMLERRLSDGNTVIQYWAAIGCRLLEERAEPASGALETALTDSPSDAVRMAVAEALCHISENPQALAVIIQYLKDDRPWVRFTAAVHLGWLGELARPAREALEAAAKDPESRPSQAAQIALRTVR